MLVCKSILANSIFSFPTLNYQVKSSDLRWRLLVLGLCRGSLLLSVVSGDVGWSAVSGMLSASVCIKPILLGDTESGANDLPGCK